MYDIYLASSNVENSNVVFREYMQVSGGSVCPLHGEMNYIDGQIECSIHGSPDQENDTYDEEPPYL